MCVCMRASMCKNIHVPAEARGVEPPGAGGSSDCEPPCQCCERSLAGPRGEQCVL